MDYAESFECGFLSFFDSVFSFPRSLSLSLATSLSLFLAISLYLSLQIHLLGKIEGVC